MRFSKKDIFKAPKRFISIFFFLILPSILSAQTRILEGRVYDSESKVGLPFVNIHIRESNSGGVTDLDGFFRFRITEGAQEVEFSFIGYEKTRIQLKSRESNFMEVAMKPLPDQLREVDVKPGINPAHRLIQGVIDNKSHNQPEALDAYRCKSYSKLIFGVDEDELQIADTLELHEDDTVGLAVRQFFGQQHFFVSESVSERTFKKPGKVNENVIATRSSGFKNPIFTILATQIQSFSFYDERFRLIGQEMLNPFNRHFKKHYAFEITDTTLINEGQDTIYSIRFQPFHPNRIEGMKGEVKIQTPDMAIRSVKAEPARREDDFPLRIEIRQLYEKQEGGWFPMQLHADFTFDNIKLEEDGLEKVLFQGRIRTYLREIEINPELKRKDISSLTVRVDPDAHLRDSAFWSVYRPYELDRREERTYVFMDSLGEKYNFERYANLLQALSDGYLRMSYFDLDLLKLMRVNQYENFYLGLGGRTNRKFSKHFTLTGHFGYGFRDRGWKYGYSAEAMLHRKSQLRIGGGYYFDIEESGAGRNTLTTRPVLFTSESRIRQFFVSVFDQVSNATFYVKWDPIATWKNKFSIVRENRFVVNAPYFYQDNNFNTVPTNGYIFTFLRWEGRYAPRELIIEKQDERRSLFPRHPIFMWKLERAFTGLAGGESDFTRAEIRVEHKWDGFLLGSFATQLSGGFVDRPLPYSYLFNPRSNLSVNEDGWFPYAPVADVWAWETLGFNELLMDTYVELMARWNLGRILFKRNRYFPGIELVYKTMYGSIRNPENHEGLNTAAPINGIHETGLQFNGIYKNLGLGVFYRPGETMGNPLNYNWLVKLTVGI